MTHRRRIAQASVCLLLALVACAGAFGCSGDDIHAGLPLALSSTAAGVSHPHANDGPGQECPHLAPDTPVAAVPSSTIGASAGLPVGVPAAATGGHGLARPAGARPRSPSGRVLLLAQGVART